MYTYPSLDTNSEDAAEGRASATSAEDLNNSVVGGRIPRTLLKLLVYCRVSDRSTCEVLLELGKVKVNGEVTDDPVALVRPCVLLSMRRTSYVWEKQAQASTHSLVSLFPSLLPVTLGGSCQG